MAKRIKRVFGTGRYKKNKDGIEEHNIMPHAYYRVHLTDGRTFETYDANKDKDGKFCWIGIRKEDRSFYEVPMNTVAYVEELQELWDLGSAKLPKIVKARIDKDGIHFEDGDSL